MFQSYDPPDHSAAAPARLAQLRAELARRDLAACLIPRADAHQGEDVAACDARLAWTTGFTGSAGLAAISATQAAIFVDGRYTLQARRQCPEEIALRRLEPEALRSWLTETLKPGDRLGVDTWLHGAAEIARLEADLAQIGATLACLDDNPVDAIWSDRPQPPSGAIRIHPAAYAGESSRSKRARIGAAIGAAGADFAFLSATDSTAWLLNIRGSDIARSPAPRAFAMLAADGTATLFAEAEKLDAALRAHLGDEVRIVEPDQMTRTLQGLGGGKALLDRRGAPFGAARILRAAGAEIIWGEDPCVAPKARKNAAELDGMRAAHLRDGAAMARFLCWLEREAPRGGLSEIDVAGRLAEIRAEDPMLEDLSFDTISGVGPHGAIIHYRVTRATNRAVTPGAVLLVDSGGQYQDGTTDITRTLAVGAPEPEAQRLFTLVLKGMIAVSRARFPAGTTGCDLDAMARMALWAAGHDYDHGTGHGVGAALNVHEGPVSLSRRGAVALEPGMVLSNEPGCYLEGRFGIRIENLLIVTEPGAVAGGARDMMGFETLSWAPIDRRLIRPELLTQEERDWLNAYHAGTRARIGPLLDAETAGWLDAACAAL